MSFVLILVARGVGAGKWRINLLSVNKKTFFFVSFYSLLNIWISWVSSSVFFPTSIPIFFLRLTLLSKRFLYGL